MINFEKYKHLEPTFKPNKIHIPITEFLWQENCEFNEIYRWCVELESEGELNRFQVTPRGSIRQQYKNNFGGRYYVFVSSSSVELILSHPDTGKLYRFRAVAKKHEKGDGHISGWVAFKKFCKEIRDAGFDIEELAVENGFEIKQQIPKPKISFNCLKGEQYIYENVHHIDLNSAYVAGIAEDYPQLRPGIESMYAKRQSADGLYKSVLAQSTGYFQSEWVDYRFSNLALSAHLYTHRRLNELTEKIEAAGGSVLGYNTDGIWYQGDIYHDEQEGTALGQWKTDHKNCKIRVKSDGAYEFIDGDGKYHAVYRGCTTLDSVKDRSEWVWGDIFKTAVLKYQFIEGIGIIEVEGELER